MVRIAALPALVRHIVALFAILAAQMLLAPAAHAQSGHTSTLCAAKTATVSSGGTVTINITDCAFNSGFYATGPVDGGSFGTPDFPNHGTATLRVTGGQWFVDYNHNGSTGIGSTDTFEFQDGSLNGCCDTLVTISITAATSPLTVSPSTLPTITAGVAFSQTLTTTGGSAPYSYTLQSGALPPGLSLSSGGVVSGTPTERGVYSFSVRATDSSTPTPIFVDKGYSGTTQNPTLTLATPSATAIQGVAFNQSLSTTGGVAPYLYQLETGTLPAGITLSSGGVLSGTTTAATGNYPVTIRVTDSSTGPGVYFEVENFTLTVSPPPSVSIAVSPASVSEDGATNLTYTVTRSANLSSATTVNITTAGTATSGTDYIGAVSTVTIPAGATTATIVIDPTVDGTIEPDETVTLIVAAGTGYTVGAPSSAVGTILNDDVPSLSIAVSPASVAEDGAPNLVYTVTLNQAANNALSVGYTIGGTATNGTDYATIGTVLVIPAGNTTGTITVNPTADATIEADETVTLALAAGAGYSVGVPNAATGTILNDDLPNLTINDVTVTEGNSGVTNATFTVSLSAPAGPGGVTFNIATANGTATAGTDYVAQTLASQTIPAGSSTYTFTVQVNGDALNESTETFFVNVTGVTNSVVVDGQGVGTITNDDPTPTLSTGDVTVTEGDSGTTSAVVTVTLSAASGQTVTVNYATADGTAAQPADYTSTAGTLTFTPGQTTRTVTIPVIGETVPEANENFTLGLSGATNASIGTASATITITNDDVPITLSPASIPGGTVGVAYSQTLTASGGSSPYTYSVTSGALPAGLTFSGSTFSGTPTAAGTFNFTITATDSSTAPGPFSAGQAYSLTIAAPTISLPATSLAGGTLGSSYSASIAAASGGTSPYTYAVTAGSLPGGLALNSASGAITGTPSALGTFNFTVTATDSSTGTGAPFSAAQSYAITVIDVPPVAGPVSMTVPYNAGPTAVPVAITGGTPTSYGEVIPSTNGTVIALGTTLTYQPNPGYSGPDSFTYNATNSGGTSAPALVSITVGAPTLSITAGGPLSAMVGTPYSQTFTFAGGATPFGSYAVTGLPAGLSITGSTASTVTVSGTPTAAGSFALTVSGTDSSGGSGPFSVSQGFTLAVAAPGLSLTPAAATLSAPYAVPFTRTFTASGGTGAFSYVLTGTLPAGMSFSGNSLSGTPTVPGSYPITVTATDTGATGAGAPFTVSANYTIDVPAPTIAVTPASLPNPTFGSAYNQVLAASGGAISYTFAITAGRLPNGLSLSGANIAGTSYEVGTFTFTVTVTDGYSQAGSRAYTLTIAPPTYALTPGGSALNAPYAAPYSQTFSASGGSGTFAYVLSGALPAGLSFSNGTISGTATAPGSYPITVTATDQTATGTGAPFTVAQSYTLTVAAPTIAIAPASLPGTTTGSTYSQTLTASGGAGSYTFAITGGALPAGVTLSGATLSGRPTAAGNFGFTVTATDSFGQSAARSYTLAVAAPTLTLTPGSSSFAPTYAAPFSQSFAAGGGVGPYTYALTGTLPAGLTFAPATATISGTPTATGSFSFGVTATDTGSTGAGAPFTVAGAYTMTIAAPTITVTPSPLPGATAGQAYAVTLTGAGAVAPYRFTLASGTLPAGVTLSTAGQLAGTPSAAGSFPISVEVRDANGQVSTIALTLNVAVPSLTVTPATLPAAQVGLAYSQTLTVSGGIAPYSFAVGSGALPGGLTLNPTTGQITGTPTAQGSFAFAITVRDSTAGTAATATINYTLAVQQRPDPANDPEVRGLVQAQAQAARRFATTQINNVQQRLERLHQAGEDDGNGEGSRITVSNALRITAPDICRDAQVMANSARCSRQRSALSALTGLGGYSEAGTSTAVGAAAIVPVTGTALPAATGGEGKAAATGGTASGPGTWGLWTAGQIRFGDQDAAAGRDSLEFNSEGISIGADYRFSRQFAAGLSVGFGRDTVDIGSDGSRSRGEAKSLALYASLLPGGGVFIDGMIGYQWLDFDLRRYVTSTGRLVDSQRSGHQWFGSVSLGADIATGAWQLTPYARLDLSRARLAGYTERSGSIFDLTFLDQQVDSTTLGLGGRARYRHDLGWARLYPELRAEYLWQLDRNGDVLVTYADRLSGPYSAIRLAALDRDELVLGGKLDLELDSGWLFGLEYVGRIASGSGSDSTVKVVISHEF